MLSESWGKGKDYDPTSTNYWSANAKNAKKAVEGLINLCLVAPTFTFQGD